MCAVKREQGFVERPISGIEVLHAAVAGTLTQTAAPRVREVIRETVGQAFGELQGHGVIGGTAGIGGHDDRRILRIGDDEVIGKSVSRKQTARLSR